MSHIPSGATDGEKKHVQWNTSSSQKPQTDSQQEFDTLVLSGGGILGTAQLGVCWELERRGVLGGITHMIGTSIGALICALMAMRFPVLTIEEYLTGRQVFEMAFETPDMSNHLFGCHEALHTSLSFFVERVLGPGGATVSFADVEACWGVRLGIVAVDYARQDVCVFDPTTTPHMSVLDAVTASMAYPELVGPLRPGDTDRVYLDGGLLYNFPIAEAPGPTTLGICVASPFACDQPIESDTTPPRLAVRLAHWVNYVATCANTLYLRLRGFPDGDMDDGIQATILRIPRHPDFGPLDMHHDRQTLKRLFDHGKACVATAITAASPSESSCESEE